MTRFTYSLAIVVKRDGHSKDGIKHGMSHWSPYLKFMTIFEIKTEPTVDEKGKPVAAYQVADKAFETQFGIKATGHFKGSPILMAVHTA